MDWGLGERGTGLEPKVNHDYTWPEKVGQGPDYSLDMGLGVCKTFFIGMYYLIRMSSNGRVTDWQTEGLTREPESPWCFQHQWLWPSWRCVTLARV